MRRLYGFLISLLILITGSLNPQLYINRDSVVSDAVLPGARWLDTDGNPIQAHGGQVQRMPVPAEDGETRVLYVWVGENKNSGHTGNPVSVYTSEDLLRWEYRGDVLRPLQSVEDIDTDPYFRELYGSLSDAEKEHVYACIGADKVIERPKMLYNEKNDNYVLWFHNDFSTEKNSYLYDVGMAGLAVSDSPFGPFRFIDRYRLSECPPDQIDCFPLSKGEARDMNLFQDDDGTAYIVYTSENNKTLYISRLNEDYTGLSGTEYGVDYIRIFPGAMREAPVVMKHEGRYYLMSSSTTGWMSNQARVWSAGSIFGRWRNDGNPCVGKGASVTFDTQSTTLFQTASGQWVYGGDRWDQNDLADSRYIWLPVDFQGDRLQITWQTSWLLDASE